MGAWFRHHPVGVIFAVLGAALAVVIGLEIALSRRADTVLQAAPRAAATSEAKLLPPLTATSVEQEYPETAARPLWTPTRRPAPEQVAAAQNTFQTGQFQLQGVIIAGATRVAMLREKANGKVHRVELGREVNGIKIADIQPEVVTLVMGGQNETVPLAVSKAAAPPQVAQAGPFAAPGTPGAAPSPTANPLAHPTGAPAAPPPAAPAPPAAVPPPGTPGAPGTPSGPFGRYPAVQEPAAAAGAAPPMSPEEVLARRRARRAQQTQ